MIDTKNLKVQAKKNILFNLIIFIITIVIGIWLPPYLINNLGVSAYGLIPISMSIVSYMLIFTVSINGTISRFLVLDFSSNKNNTSNTFSTAFYTIFFITIITFPIAVYICFNIDKILSIPVGFLSDASTMFMLVISAFFINSFSSLFNSIAYVKNRIDLRNISVILIRSLMLIFLVYFFANGFINLKSYGYSILIASFIGGCYSFFIFKKLTPETKINFNYFSLDSLKQLSKTGFWLIMDQIGVVLFLQTDIIILNFIKGPEISGTYAALLQWSFMIRAFISVFSGIIGPVILNLYANQNSEKLRYLTSVSIKFLGIFTSVLVFILSYFSEDILRIWLGPKYEPFKWVFITMIIHLSFNLSVGVLNNISLAHNKVKLPGIVAMLTGCTNIILGALLLIYTDLNYYAIAIAGFVSLTIKNGIFAPMFNAKIMSLPLKTFYKPMVPSIILMCFTLIITFTIPSSSLLIQNSYSKLFIFSSLGFLMLSIIVFLIFLTNDEKKLIITILKSKFK